MKTKILLFVSVLFLSPFLRAQSSCYDVFLAEEAPLKSPQSKVSAEKITEMQALQLVAFPVKEITLPEVKDFSSDKGSLQIFLKSIYRSKPDGFKDNVINLIFNLTGVHAMIFRNLTYFQANPNILTHAKKGDWGAKKTMISLLRGIEPLIAQAVGKEKVDLLSLETWLELYGVSTLSELLAKIENHRSSIYKDSYYEEFQTPERVEMMKMVDEISPRVFEVADASGGLLSTGRAHHFALEVETLITKLHLSKDRLDHYQKILKEFDSSNWASGLSGNVRQMKHDLDRLNFFIHAYLERFPDQTATPIVMRFSSTWFLNAVRNTETFNHVFEINEARLSENLTLLMSINEQIDRFQADADAILSAGKREGAEAAEQITEIYNLKAEAEALRVQDLTAEDISGRLISLQNLQFRLHHPVEKILNTIGPQSIETFTELNFNWSRVVAGKSYAIEGKDYHFVIFEKDVLNFLKHEGVVGDRTLVALEKGYVGAHGQTGVRMVTTLHKDLRYIKVMMGRKVRIIGKLVDGRLHFFSVWNKDENWDVHWMHALIENYEPKG